MSRAAGTIIDMQNRGKFLCPSRGALVATLRWARFEGFEDEATWDLVRSHAPVIADGVTPFDADLEFTSIGYQAVTVNLKYRF